MFDTETAKLGLLVGHCGHLGKRCLDLRLRRLRYNITPVQSQALQILSCTGREVNQRDLERELRLKAPTVNGIVDRMAEKGFITRTTSRTDGRCRVLELSGKGREAVESFRTAARRSDELIRGELSDPEEQLLRDMLGRLIVNLENEVNKG